MTIRYKKRPIRRKIATFILVVGMFPVIIGTAIIYQQGKQELTESVGNNFYRIASEIASKIEILIDQSLYNVQTLTLSPVLKGAVAEANRTYRGKDKASILLAIQRNDARWVQHRSHSRGIDELLSTPSSQYLATIAEQREQYVTIILTDMEGVLVAASHATKYTYFGGDKWWQAAYNDGRGDVYVSEIYLDPDRSEYLIRIAAPLMDDRGEHVIGILHVVSRIGDISQVVQRPRIGQTGHAMLINSAAVILLCPIFPPQSHKVTKALMADISRPSIGWAVVKDNAHGGVNAIAGFAPITSAYQRGGNTFDGGKWYIFVSQSPSESYAPIKTLLKRMVSLLIFAVVILSAMGFWAARRIVKPIHLLQRSVGIIGAGDLDHRIDIKTGDEIEDLAEEFNSMVQKIKESYTELEQRVAERTEDLKKGFQEMENINRLKSEFLANMSHELRTPLNSILGFSEMLKDGLYGELTGKQYEYVDYIFKSGQHLLELISDILDLSKVEAGKMDVKPIEFSVPKAIEEVHSIINPMAMKKKISIDVEIADNVSSIVADERMFKQVMYNLLSNATKFTSEEGILKVVANSNDYYLQIAVIDNGQGIREEDMNLIFKEFEQIDSSTTRGHEGTGLGLALTKRYVEMQGGTITVESEYGQGSNFTFRIPVDITAISSESST
ncbi:MAG: sensor histidine kinase [Thermodesulfobacteriota bacterium]